MYFSVLRVNLGDFWHVSVGKDIKWKYVFMSHQIDSMYQELNHLGKCWWLFINTWWFSHTHDVLSMSIFFYLNYNAVFHTSVMRSPIPIVLRYHACCLTNPRHLKVTSWRHEIREWNLQELCTVETPYNTIPYTTKSNIARSGHGSQNLWSKSWIPVVRETLNRLPCVLLSHKTCPP